MAEWIMIVVTSAPGLIQAWDGRNVIHVRYKTEQSCKTSITDIKEFAPNVPSTMTCIKRSDLPRFRLKAKPS